MKENNIYSDLDLSLKVHPLTGDLIPKKNVEAIRRSIRTIFNLDSYDIPFEPNKKTKMKSLLFEPSNHLTEISIRTNLEWAFKKMEPRAKLNRIDVDASADGLGYNITVFFLIKSLMVEDQYSFFVQRVR